MKTTNRTKWAQTDDPEFELKPPIFVNNRLAKNSNTLPRYIELRQMICSFFDDLTMDANPASSSLNHFHAKTYLKETCRRIIEGM